MERKQPLVLVIRGGAIGDFILTLPAIRLLRESIPGCYLEVLGYPGIMDLAVKAGLADATRSLEHRSMALLFAKGAPIDPDLAEYLCSFNLVVSYLYDPDGILKSQLEIVGVKTLIECPHSVKPGAGHASLQLAKPLEKLAMYLDEPEWRAPLFKAANPALQAKKVAFHSGSGSEKKNWPAEHWLKVINELRQNKPDLELILITGEAELARGTPVEAFAATEHWHGLPLPELAEKLASCDLFLGHDSGISHLASACGVPSVLLFGPTNPQIWAPPQPGVTIIQAENGDWDCLSPEKVIECVQQKMGADR